MKKISININEINYECEVEEELRLIDLLRDRLHLTGSKEGCGEGECGACTVIMNGRIVNSCLVLAFQADGSKITTIEGVEEDDHIKKAFLEVGAVQCGFCFPGMVLAAKSLLDKNTNPDEHEIREAISGNLCRCTGYNKIVEGIKLASTFIRGDKGE
ncbi:Nicotinate dehydrogenase small FeS subunit [Caloramator mitchellensis]|uniref:Nicotinate dehydrogenase small FeS subunit n=1 Tax=Caloramator mitchellensis TaxID=908809 RepID=A0A0R3JVK3_CALMK|nr:(2Fe-2S)-binding protein [Caloramator mitchellensis]KRQ87576.1 Nicotinate dehydrogenase small FeS subunit [Caloramator mitchellensis]